MGLLTNTNIVVDDFRFAKKQVSTNYVYLLTHMHSDHYMGITNSWNYGPIYCSPVTALLLKRRFSKLECIVPLELNKKHTLYLDQDKSLSATVIFFDANHIFGSVMMLFEGYFGRYLHTGDFRFHEHMWLENPYLFPRHLPRTPEGLPRSIQVDELILDNTYCDPIFNFPVRVDIRS